MNTTGKKMLLPEKRRTRSPGWRPALMRPAAKRCERRRNSLCVRWTEGLSADMKAGLGPWGRGCVGEVKRNLGREAVGMGRVQREWMGILRVVVWWLALWVWCCCGAGDRDS